MKKPRDLVIVTMRNRGIVIISDKRKDKSKKACRTKVKIDG